LLIWIECGHHADSKLLIKQGVLVNACTQLDLTPFLISFQSSYHEISKLLIE
jgi:hypothetical protein